MRRSGRATFSGASRVVAVVCALLLAFSACSTRSSGSPVPAPEPTLSPPSGRPLQPAPAVTPPGFAGPPPGSGLSRYERQALVWQPCRDGLQCAKLLVPLDYSQPDGVAITLALAKKPATATPKLGTLFIDPGGPGASGMDYLGFFRTKGLESYDIVGWDPRGVGQSTPVDCSGVDLDRYLAMDMSPDSPAELSALLDANRQFGLDCLARSGPLLAHVSTVEVARDLDVMRMLVGDDKLNLFGASYGTQIGATYAQLFPRQVGRMVLDGAVNINDDDRVTQGQGFDRALGNFAQWCADRHCKLGATKAEVLKSVVALLTTLDAHPVKVGARQLTQQLAVAGVEGVLYYNQNSYKYLLQALQLVIEDQEGRFLLFLADEANQRDAQGRYNQIDLAFPAITCLDQPDHGVQGEITLAKAVDKIAPNFGPFFGPNLICPEWPVPAVLPLKLVAAGAAPIVVIGTTGDPATPYEHAVSMAKQLQSGVLVTFKGQGHTAYGQSPCVQQLVDAYLVQGIVPRDGTTC